MTEEEKVIKRKEVNMITSRIRSLKPKLFNAVYEEEYKKAATLRDEIKKKQNELMRLLLSW